MDGVAAVSWGAGRVDLFWREADGGLAHRAFEAEAWGDVESLAARSPRGRQ